MGPRRSYIRASGGALPAECVCQREAKPRANTKELKIHRVIMIDSSEGGLDATLRNLGVDHRLQNEQSPPDRMDSSSCEFNSMGEEFLSRGVSRCDARVRHDSLLTRLHSVDWAADELHLNGTL